MGCIVLGRQMNVYFAMIPCTNATTVFWRLAGGEEEELLALRVLLLDMM